MVRAERWGLLFEINLSDVQDENLVIQMWRPLQLDHQKTGSCLDQKTLFKIQMLMPPTAMKFENCNIMYDHLDNTTSSIFRSFSSFINKTQVCITFKKENETNRELQRGELTGG